MPNVVWIRKFLNVMLKQTCEIENKLPRQLRTTSKPGLANYHVGTIEDAAGNQRKPIWSS